MLIYVFNLTCVIFKHNVIYIERFMFIGIKVVLKAIPMEGRVNFIYTGKLTYRSKFAHCLIDKLNAFL